MDEKSTVPQLTLGDAADLAKMLSPRRGYRHTSINYTRFMKRDQPQPFRAILVRGLNGEVYRSLCDYGAYEGKSHSRAPPLGYRVCTLGSTSSFADARLRSHNQNAAIKHLTDRSNLTLSVRQNLPGFDEDLVNEIVDRRILSAVLDFTAALLPSSNTDQSTAALADLNNDTKISTQSASSEKARTKEDEHVKRLATMYSERSGRLVPPTWKPMTKSVSLGALDMSRWKAETVLDLISDQRQRIAVELLCQLLQTDDLAVVSHWVENAKEVEKTLLVKLLGLTLNARLKELENESGNTVEPTDVRLPQSSPSKTVASPKRESNPRPSVKLPPIETQKPTSNLRIRFNSPDNDTIYK